MVPFLDICIILERSLILAMILIVHFSIFTTKVNIFSYYLLLLDVNKIPDRYLMHMVEITNYENGRSRDVGALQLVSVSGISQNQSASISINKHQSMTMF